MKEKFYKLWMYVRWLGNPPKFKVGDLVYILRPELRGDAFSSIAYVYWLKTGGKPFKVGGMNKLILWWVINTELGIDCPQAAVRLYKSEVCRNK